MVLTRVGTTEAGRSNGEQHRNVPDTILEEEAMDMTPAPVERPRMPPPPAPGIFPVFRFYIHNFAYVQCAKIIFTVEYSAWNT